MVEYWNSGILMIGPAVHSIIPSFHHSIIPSFHHSIIPSFHHSVVPLFRCSVVPPVVHFNSTSAGAMILAA